ncbi:MAG: DUF983 domain-containing protein [Pseudomonadota bacterium]
MTHDLDQRRAAPPDTPSGPPNEPPIEPSGDLIADPINDELGPAEARTTAPAAPTGALGDAPQPAPQPDWGAPAPGAAGDGTGHAPALRPLMPALRCGWRGACPACGRDTLWESYLQVRGTCATCGEALHHHRADDLPAWATMVIVGHVLVVALLAVENAFAPALWVHALIWPVVVIGLSLWFLPRIKGAVVAMQWAWRMHGFDSDHSA